MENLTTKIDYYIKNLIRNRQLVWAATLNNGQIVYSDFEREFLDHPWNRLSKHLEDSGLCVISVKVLGLGAPEFVLGEDPDGLDGFFILRGLVKDVSLEAGEDPLQFQKMTFGVWDAQKQHVKVKTFYWPEQDMWPIDEVRQLTTENYNQMIFKTEELKEKLREIAKTV
jgi:hypothetical protein